MKITNTRQIDDYMWPAPRLLLASARPMGSRYGGPGFRGAAAARRASSARVHEETVHCQLFSHTYSGYPSYHSLSCGVAIAWTLLSTQVRNSIIFRAAYRPIGSTTGCTITEKAPTRALSWLKAAITAFTFKALLIHYAKWALNPRSLNVKLGPRRKGHKGRADWLA